VSASRRRLFFALWPDDPVRQALFHWQTHNLSGKVRWVHRADLHLTLHFLGMVDAERIDDLRHLGGESAGDAFSLVLDKVGRWPRPQVLWAAPSSVPGDLRELHATLGEGLAGLGFEPEARSYQPHVTLARKVGDEARYGPLLPVTWPVRELALVESRPGDAPHYRPLQRWPLA